MRETGPPYLKGITLSVIKTQAKKERLEKYGNNYFQKCNLYLLMCCMQLQSSIRRGWLYFSAEFFLKKLSLFWTHFCHYLFMVASHQIEQFTS